MKNIHVLPTDKPSTLYKRNDKNSYHLGDFTVCEKGDKLRTNQHIYITSDEGIKEGDWIITKGKLVQLSCLSYDLVKGAKVILTTDQDLIKDGVQAIDDEFIEWFVNNPSCEEVEIEKFHGINTSIAEVSSISGNDDYNWQGKGDFRDYKIVIPKKEPKQETLEELKKWKKEALIAHEINQKVIEKLMAEKKQMYSDEEVLEFTQTIIQQYKLGNTNIEQLDLLKETLEQFKNK